MTERLETPIDHICNSQTKNTHTLSPQSTVYRSCSQPRQPTDKGTASLSDPQTQFPRPTVHSPQHIAQSPKTTTHRPQTQGLLVCQTHIPIFHSPQSSTRPIAQRPQPTDHRPRDCEFVRPTDPISTAHSP